MGEVSYPGSEVLLESSYPSPCAKAMLVTASKRSQLLRILKRKTAAPAERVAHGLELDEKVRHVM